jgi:GDP-D-mannose dehydratase
MSEHFSARKIALITGITGNYRRISLQHMLAKRISYDATHHSLPPPPHTSQNKIGQDGSYLAELLLSKVR